MAKQGQHNDDSRDQDKSRNHNNPDKSVTITTGSYKKPETDAKQAREHKDLYQVAQHDKNEWHEQPRATAEEREHKRERIAAKGDNRSGSDSNAGPHTRGH